MQKTIFVANLDQSMATCDLYEMFSQYGKVVRAKVWFDLETGDSRGYGFVEMQEEPDARIAIECLNGRRWLGRRLRVSFARPKHS